MGEVTGVPSTARIADTVLRMSGLNWWTDAGRSAFKLEMELVVEMVEMSF